MYNENGKITIKKGLKKGTYKIKVKVTAAGNKSYKSAVKTVTVKIVVKQINKGGALPLPFIFLLKAYTAACKAFLPPRP